VWEIGKEKEVLDLRLAGDEYNNSKLETIEEVTPILDSAGLARLPMLLLSTIIVK
jgi:hypothetical protein